MRCVFLPALDKKGIHAVRDGEAPIRKYASAWTTATLQARSYHQWPTVVTRTGPTAGRSGVATVVERAAPQP